MPAAQPPSAARLARQLADVFGVHVEIAGTARPGPWAVRRVALTPTDPAVPASVVVKWLRDDPNGFRVDPAQTHVERAALEFLADVTPSLVPRIFGAVPAEAGLLLVLEDLTPRVPLADLIRRNGAAGTFSERFAFARDLGRFHAATTGRESDFYARRLAVAPGAGANRKVERTRMLGRSWTQTCALLAALDVKRTTALDTEAAHVWAAFDQPGALLCMTNGDMAANNFMVEGQDGRIIDFEFAAYQHALLDCVWMHVPGPAWVAVRDPVADQLETTYRTELCRAVPAAGVDDIFDTGMAMACVVMAVERIGNVAKIDARPAGDPSRLQRVETLAAAARQAQRRRRLPHLSAWLWRLVTTLQRRWPETAAATSTLGPYTPRW